MSGRMMVVLVVLCKSLLAALGLLLSAYLIMEGKDGWGWILFATVLVGGVSVSEGSGNDKG